MATPFSVGDVVFDEQNPKVLGLVTEVHTGERRGITVVFEDGDRVGGGLGFARVLRRHAPRARCAVPPGALGARGWNRQQAISAALRRAGVR